MSITENFTQEILVSQNLKSNEKVGKTIKMAPDTAKALVEAGEETVFSQESILKIGIFYGRLMHEQLMSKKLKSAKEKFKRSK